MSGLAFVTQICLKAPTVPIAVFQPEMEPSTVPRTVKILHFKMAASRGTVHARYRKTPLKIRFEIAQLHPLMPVAIGLTQTVTQSFSRMEQALVTISMELVDQRQTGQVIATYRLVPLVGMISSSIIPIAFPLIRLRESKDVPKVEKLWNTPTTRVSSYAAIVLILPRMGQPQIANK